MSFPVIPNVTFLSCLGAGSTGEVFLARTAPGSLLAVKVLHPGLSQDSDAAQRLGQEARILSKLNDSRIVQCLGVERTNDGRLALLQEYVDGQSIAQLLQQPWSEPARVALALALGIELLGALEEAHRQGVIHRDVKPENILLSGQGRLKLTDFGVARNLESLQMTVTGRVMGSPNYMSPEQVQGQPIDQRSDLFSIGVLMHKIVSQQLPFTGTTMGALFQQILHHSPLALGRLNPWTPPMLGNVVTRLLSKDPADRWSRAYEARFYLMQVWDQSYDVSVPKFLQQVMDPQGITCSLGSITNLLNSLVATRELPYLQQALQLSPEYPAALAGIKGLQQSNNKPVRQRQWAYGLIALLILVSGLGYFLYPKLPPANVTAEEAPVQTRAAAPQPEVIAPTVSIPPPSPIPAANKPLPTGFIELLVDDDVSVRVGKRLYQAPVPRRVKVPAGVQQIELIKPGFNPIRSKISVTPNQSTTINARRPPL